MSLIRTRFDDGGEWSPPPCAQIGLFVSTLYGNDDLIEVRPIETWNAPRSRKRRSRLIRDYHWWLSPRDVRLAYDELADLNREQHANIFVGVNPRPHPGATKKRDIRLCRSVWADIDNVTIDDATFRWLASTKYCCSKWNWRACALASRHAVRVA